MFVHSKVLLTHCWKKNAIFQGLSWDWSFIRFHCGWLSVTNATVLPCSTCSDYAGKWPKPCWLYAQVFCMLARFQGTPRQHGIAEGVSFFVLLLLTYFWFIFLLQCSGHRKPCWWLTAYSSTPSLNNEVRTKCIVYSSFLDDSSSSAPSLNSEIKTSALAAVCGWHSVQLYFWTMNKDYTDASDISSSALTRLHLGTKGSDNCSII